MKHRLVFILAIVGILTPRCYCDIPVQETPIQSQMDLLVMARDTWEDGEESTVTEDKDDVGESAEANRTGQRSVLKAGLLSVLVPGGGQYYNGHGRKARYFFAAEALTWLGYAAFRTYGNWKEDDYMRYAAVNANADLEGKSDEFIDLVGFYDDIYQYNSLGRAYDPERPYLTDTPENHWLWQSDSDRREFRDLKNRSKEAYRRADFMIGVAVIDRIISAIDAVRDALRANRRIDADFASKEQPALKFAVNPLSSRKQFTLTLFPGL